MENSIVHNRNRTTTVILPEENWNWVHNNGYNFSAIIRKAILDMMEMKSKHGVNSVEEMERKLLQTGAVVIDLERRLRQREKLLKYYEEKYGEFRNVSPT